MNFRFYLKQVSRIVCIAERTSIPGFPFLKYANPAFTFSIWFKMNIRKLLLFTICTFIMLAVSAQDYLFSKDYVSGSVTLKNSVRIPGEIKWMPDQTTRLKFSKNIKSSPVRYSPEDLLGFQVDSLRFVSVFNFEVYAENYEFLGNTTKIKSTFAQLLDSGNYNILLVTTSGYNRNGDLQYYKNYLFQRKSAGGFQYAAYPIGLYASEKNYDQVKQKLLQFFKDDPVIIAKIKTAVQQDDFSDTVEQLKKLN